MISSVMKSNLLKSGIATCALLLASGAVLAQQAINLSAGPTSTVLPDGQSVPMWGYTCGAVVSGSGATCAPLNPNAGVNWSPVVITIAADAPGGLQINLANNLSFPNANTVPTSIVIVGQLGGGLGTDQATMASPTAHAPQGTTWPGTLGGTNSAAGDAVFTPPAQVKRVRSMATEVAAGSSAALTWSSLRPGTYLIESGTEPSIQGPMGLYGVLVVTEPDDTSGTTPAHVAYATNFDASVPLLLSEIDPVQNREVAQVVQNKGFDETTVWSGKAPNGITPGGCGDVTQPATAHTCYPPAVNYTPMYYLVNGASFDRTSATATAIAVPAAGAQKNVLLRLVNAGLHLHVPSVVGAKMTLLAEDGNALPGNARVQNEVSLAAGKTYDAVIQPSQTTAGTYDAATYAVFDRALGLSTGNQRDGGMQVLINVAGGGAAVTATLSASDKSYSCVAGSTLSITDPAKGLLAGAVGANGLVLGATNFTVTTDTLNLNSNGTFTYVPTPGTTCGGSFTYLINGTQPHTATITQCDANSAAAPGCTVAALTAGNIQFVSNVATRYVSSPPGVLAGAGSVDGLTGITASGAGINADGSFVATGPGISAACDLFAGTLPTGATCVKLPYTVKNLQGKTATATATVAFLPASGLTVNVKDAPTGKPVADYRWIIEEDRTFWVDPKCQVNSTDASVRPSTCPPLPVESLGYNFHSANMPVIATGCVGTVSCEAGQKLQGADAVCDIGNGACRTGATQKTPTYPADVHLDPAKRYFISILPGDAINPTISGFGGTVQDCGTYDPTDSNWVLYNPADGSSGNCGHEMGGSQLAPGQIAANVNLQQIPLPTAKISVFVFEDDNPLNGENDAGGGVDVVAPNEPGLGGFEIKLFDQAGQLGDNTGQITYDEFNQPVSNALAGYVDPATGLDACPINARKDGLVGMVPTCPKYEADGKTASPLAGQVVIDHLYPGLYEIQAYAAADRIAAGEEWLQTNTLDGGKPHEAFIKPDEPGYFQEFGPGGFHVAIGFANPAIINARKAGYCSSTLNPGGASSCNNTLKVHIANNHMSRTPDQRTYSTETYDHYAWTNCYVSVGPADSEDFAFQKCTDDGNVTFTGMPAGTFKISVFDQWNDIMLDGLVGTVEINGGGGSTAKEFPVTQWRTNLYTRTYLDTDGSGVSDDSKPGLALVNTNIRYRDGSIGFFNNTDLNGYAGFNEVFPFMNWLVVDTTQTRFKPTWTHVVYDAGGTVDGSAQSGAQAHTPNWSASTIAANMANTDARVPLPAALRIPGAKYCDNADCPAGDSLGGASTGILFPPQAFSNSIGWQGLLGQNTFIEFGVKPFKKAGVDASGAATPAENGGISGQVIYASTRPFDDPSLLLQLSWEPGIPHATINLYSKTVDANGNESLKLVDSTQSASWDDWAQGFRKDANGALLKAPDGNYIPNMNCPGQDATSPFFATLKDSKEWLDASNPKRPLAYGSQFKCYDGWSQLNQAQPAPYDGYYKFPSVVTMDPATGKPAKTNCTGCIANPDDGTAMLPAGTYVVEVVVPPGYELVKEEDKNILMGDVYVAPVTQQFAGFGNIFILPDQASVNAYYNPNNPGGLNPTNGIGSVTFPRNEGDTGSIEAFWPCVGALRQVPDFNSEFPGAQQAAPFAGAMRRLCDRKEVTVSNESASLAKFFLYSDTHIAGHFTGTITNDFASEFDPFSPQFGEKFGPPNLPVGLRDFNGNEVARVYSDQWGIYNGLYFSTWSPNPPNPTGYAPQMSIACMNDPGPIMVGGVSTTDPSYNPAYSNFCYEQPFMPGETTYMDTPVIPTQSFADGYNLPDTEYPDGTPAILKVVNGDASVPQGPWVRPATTAARAAATFTVSGANRCQTANCANRSTITFPLGLVRCTFNGTGGPNCSSSSNSTRNNSVAAYIRSNIVTLMGAGYTAGGSNASVTVNAPATGASSNGTTVVSATANLSSPTAPVQLAGGQDTAAGATTLNITALGKKVVQNPQFSGPNATTSPYNQKTIIRNYGFGSQGTTGTAVLVAPDGTTTANLTIGTWNDTTITASVPALSSAFNCKVQQIGAPTAQCGQLVITRGDNGKRSIDAVTVTVGGSTPWVVTETGVTAPAGKSVKDYGAKFGRLNLKLGATYQSPIQVALDSAAPGDLILVAPGTYHENLIMWKPVRLQGVGAASATVNADAHPAGHMDQWRRQMVCVFGLTLDGVPNIGNDQGRFDPSNRYSCPNEMFLKGDRIPFEAITGWQASGNGNLAQVLQEPTLLGAYEGAGITVVGRGVREPAGVTDFWGNDPTAAGAFPDGAVYLTAGTRDCAKNPGATDGGDYGTSNYRCNPSSIDGLSILNSSQGGGGVFVHGWAHNLDIANNRISANHGTLAGAINLGNGETPPVFVNDGAICGAGTVTLCPPIPNGTPNGATIPFGFNTGVRIHNNMLWNNASIGDALFTGTPAGAGGVTVSAGGDGYKIDHNWIAGNLTTGDGGGIQTLGVTFNGRIANNVILFNQSTNPTLPTNGGGIVIQGANEPRTLNGTECGGNTDTDCPPGLGDGTGGGLVIDGNLIYGNSAESGTGGGIALEQINGSEMIAFPRSPGSWYGVTLTNNIITNNVAGYDGGGVSMRDALEVTLVNNTIASNDTTASAGVLFKTLGAINASSPPPGCNSQTDPTLPQDPSCLGRDAPHGSQPSGLVTMAHTQNLNDAIAGIPAGNNGTRVTCPAGFGYANGNGGSLNNADCMKLSRPALINDMFWQNRTFKVDIVDTANSSTNSGPTSQQNLVALSPELNQASSGACPGGAKYWDIGLRTDDVQSGLLSAAANKLAVTNSILTGAGDIGTAQETLSSGTNRVGVANPVNAQICNGARVPPELCASGGNTSLSGAASCHGYNAPAGASESTTLATAFVFEGIQPTATVDEGHNWLNLVYGPLTLARPNVSTPTAGEQMVAGPDIGTAQGAYSIPLSSAALGGGTTSGAPPVDIYGNSRSGRNDIGAVQAGTAGVRAIVYPGSLSFDHVVQGTPATTQTLTLANNGAALAGISVVVGSTPAGAFSRPAGNAGGTCVATLAPNASCTIVVSFNPSVVGTDSGRVTVTTTTAGVTITNSPVALSGIVDPATLTATVTPGSLAFGNQPAGSTSSARALTVTNTGNAPLANLAVAFGGGTPQPFSRPTGGAGGSCTATLNVGASCTINIVFAPGTASAGTAYSRTATVSATGATVTGNPVALTGSSVTPAPVSISPNPARITLATGVITGTQTVTFANTANAGGASVTVSNVGVSGGSLLTYFFNLVLGGDNCTGATLTPGQSCTVQVRFTNVGSPRGADRSGTIRFTDSGAGSPQTGNLIGHAN